MFNICIGPWTYFARPKLPPLHHLRGSVAAGSPTLPGGDGDVDACVECGETQLAGTGAGMGWDQVNPKSKSLWNDKKKLTFSPQCSSTSMRCALWMSASRREFTSSSVSRSRRSIFCCSSATISRQRRTGMFTLWEWLLLFKLLGLGNEWWAQAVLLSIRKWNRPLQSIFFGKECRTVPFPQRAIESASSQPQQLPYSKEPADWWQ